VAHAPDKRSKTGNIFCDKSCAAKYNNRIHPKKPSARQCECGKKVSRSTNLCMECYKKKHATFNNKPLGAVVKEGIGPNKYAYIRTLARRCYKEASFPKICCLCGYSKHVEICHKKDIASFSSDTLVREVNRLDNLTALCRNCHWEFDNGLVHLR